VQKHLAERMTFKVGGHSSSSSSRPVGTAQQQQSVNQQHWAQQGWAQHGAARSKQHQPAGCDSRVAAMQ
jgi:hypothetical protein